jgi:type VI secretion system protein ImpC
MPDRVEFDVSFGRTAHQRDDGEPLRFLVLGDFSGTAAADRPALASRSAQRVDVDTIDGVVQRIGPRLNGPAGEIGFKKIDDFHPDSLYGRLELFQALREARTNPPAGTNDLLGRLLGKPAGRSQAPPVRPTSALDALIRSIVEPHIARDTLAETRPYLATLDAAIGEQMRALLHDSRFQSIESAWRGVHWLVSNLELDENLQLHLFDVTRDELLADIVAAQGTLTQTGLYRALVDRWRNVPGGQGWSALVGLLQFGPTDTDMGLLAALGLIAAQAGGPLIAGAEPALAGDTAGAFARWQALRRSEAAPWIGLAAPRVLLRLPYGQRTDPVEAFAFEEFVGPPAHEDFLWGSGSLAAALLIGRAFAARGWAMELGDEREIGDLPAYTFERDGEAVLQACAERYLTESEINSLLKAGLIPIASRRDANAVVAIRFQSVSDPPAPLVW